MNRSALFFFFAPSRLDKVKEKAILHCVDSKTNNLNNKHTVANIRTKVKGIGSTLKKKRTIAKLIIYKI